MIYGIDISTWQGPPNFDKLKEDVDFVIMRSSYGARGVDGQYKRNQKQARRIQIPRGYYHYSYPGINSPKLEANHFARVVGRLQPGEFLALDYEEGSSKDPVAWSNKFLKQLQEVYGGYKPLLYINHALQQKHDWSPVVKNDFGLWLAQWDHNKKNPAPKTQWPTVAMRQYSDKGTVSGVNGKVDMNVFYGSVESLLKYGYQPKVKPKQKPFPLGKYKVVIVDADFDIVETYKDDRESPSKLPDHIGQQVKAPNRARLFDPDGKLVDEYVPEVVVEYVVDIGPISGGGTILTHYSDFDLDWAIDTFERLKKEGGLRAGLVLTLSSKINDKLETINSYTQPMQDPTTNGPMNLPRPESDVKYDNLSSRLQNSFSFSVPVQAITSAIGVIVAHNNPGLPIEVLFAYTALIGITVNTAYDLLRLFGKRVTV